MSYIKNYPRLSRVVWVNRCSGRHLRTGVRRWQALRARVVLLGGLLGVPSEKCPHLRLVVTAVAAERADAGQLPIVRPSRDGLDVDAEHRGDFRRREQSFAGGRLLNHGCCSVALSITRVRDFCLSAYYNKIVFMSMIR